MKRLPLLRVISRPRGFTLVVTLCLMILLTILAVSLLTLSSVAMRSSTTGDNQAKAQANAKMALMLALGELQKNLGPDQRVTATASILDQSNNYANPNWTGVWRSDGLKTDAVPSPKGIIYRDDTRGVVAQGLKDQRSITRGGKYQRDTQVLGWLVSQPNPATSINPATELAENMRATLVDEGSSLSSSATVNNRHKVFAPLVPVDMADGLDGAYAWAVLDDGVKARYDLANPSTGPAATNSWRSAARNGMKQAKNGAAAADVFSKFSSTTADDIAKVASRGTVRLIEGVPAAKESDIRTRFHDVTTNSYSVLADTQLGGLRRDLSQLLQKGSAPALGNRPALTAQTPMITAPGLELVSPTWGALISWYQKAQNLSDKTMPTIAPNAGGLVSDGIQQWYKGTLNLRAMAPTVKQRSIQAMHPVVVDAGISYGASLVKTGDTPQTAGKTVYRLRMHYSPRVVLYNPYDVKLQAANYAICIEMPHVFSYAILLPGGSTQNVGMALNGQFASIRLVSGANLPHRPALSMSNVSLEPGEAVLYTANGSGFANRAIPWPKATDVNNLTSIGGVFELSPNNPLPLVDSFYFDCEQTTIELDANQLQNAAYQVFSAKDGDGEGGWKTYMHIFSLVKGNKGAGSVEQMRTGGTGFEPLQYFNQTEDGTSGSDAPWVPNGVLPGSVSSPLLETNGSRVYYPYERTKWGHRWVWLDDTPQNAGIKIGPYNTPFLDYNQLTSHNIASNWNVRGPIENCLRASAGGGRYTHGPYIDDPISWDWADPLLSPVLVKGKNRVSPFGYPGRSGGALFPLLSVPRGLNDLVSIACLQHFPWSVMPWHPSFAVGNGLADPRCARDKTVNYLAATDWGNLGTGVGIHSRKDQSRFRQAHLDAALDNQAFIHDLSYEANYALWDRYFFSTVPQSGDWTLDTPLANPRMVQNFAAPKPSLDDAKDFHRAATQFLLAGGFNVNSTSVPAWAALFASMNENPDMEIALGDGSKTRANYVFSHLIRPAGKLFSSSGNPDPYNESTWTGFRALTEAQIQELAAQIVVEVKRRGPFLSLADFINRRLVESPARVGVETDITRSGLKGTLQAAIDNTSINQSFLNTYKINKTEYAMANPTGEQIQYGSTYPKLEYPLANGSALFGLKPDHNHWADSKLVNVPTFLTQADMLQKIGQTLTARSDTFTIRSYGECREPGPNGKVLARAWCEAVVQRIPTPLYSAAADASGLDPDQTKVLGRFGRGFRVVSFRWLTPSEV